MIDNPFTVPFDYYDEDKAHAYFTRDKVSLDVYCALYNYLRYNIPTITFKQYFKFCQLVITIARVHIMPLAATESLEEAAYFVSLPEVRSVIDDTMRSVFDVVYPIPSKLLARLVSTGVRYKEAVLGDAPDTSVYDNCKGYLGDWEDAADMAYRFAAFNSTPFKISVDSKTLYGNTELDAAGFTGLPHITKVPVSALEV